MHAHTHSPPEREGWVGVERLGLKQKPSAEYLGLGEKRLPASTDSCASLSLGRNDEMFQDWMWAEPRSS